MKHQAAGNKIFNMQRSTFNSQLKHLLFGFVFFISCKGETNSQTIAKWKIEDLEQYIAKSNDPTIVNFWATYCIPCLKEIPYFEETVKKYKSKDIKLLLVSLDFKEAYPEKVSGFVDKRKFTSQVVWLDETNADYFCPKIDSTWSGVMPATLFINNKKSVRSFFEEEMSKEKFEEELRKIFND